MAKLSTDQFAQQIKAKYPQYASVDNATLTQKMLAKYPQYADRVETARAPAQKPGILPRIASDVGQAFQQRGQNVAQSKADVQSGKQSLFSGLLQSAGQAAGLIGDTLFSAGKEAVRSVAPAVIPAAKNVLAGIASSQPVQQAVQAGGEFAAKHPELSRDIGAVGNIASILPVGKAGQLAAKGVQVGAGAAKSAAVAGAEKVAGTIARQTAKTASRTAETAFRDALDISRPKMTSKLEQQAFNEGRVGKQGILKPAPVAPSAQETRIAESLQPLVEEGRVSPKFAPAKNREEINIEVSRINHEVEQHVHDPKFNQPFNEAQLRSRLKGAKDDLSIVFASDPTIERTYDAVADALVKSVGKKNIAGLFAARKSFDNIPAVKKLLDGIKGAEGENLRREVVLTVRGAANDLIGDYLPVYKDAMRRETNLLRASENIATKVRGITQEGRAMSFLKTPKGKLLKEAAIGAGLAGGAISGGEALLR
jgi:hypothetical protein